MHTGRYNQVFLRITAQSFAAGSLYLFPANSTPHFHLSKSRLDALSLGFGGIAAAPLGKHVAAVTAQVGELVWRAVLLAFASPELAAGTGLVAGAATGVKVVVEVCIGAGKHASGDGSEDEEEVGLHCVSG